MNLNVLELGCICCGGSVLIELWIYVNIISFTELCDYCLENKLENYTDCYKDVQLLKI